MSFFALTRRVSEVYDVLSPVVLGTSANLRKVGLSVPPPLTFVTEMTKGRPDAVVVRNPNSAYGLLSAATARLTGRTVVFYSQTPMHRKLKWWERFVRTFPACVAGAKWITPVLGQPEKHRPAFGALRYVPFVMEPQTAPEGRDWFLSNSTNILCVAKFMKRKNHHLFIRAISRLVESYDVKATIIGECTTPDFQARMSEVREFAHSMGLDESVSFRLNLPYTDVQKEYTRHDLFVLPSRDEPAAVSHLEAMSHSLPVICSDSNGTQCYIRPGENGYIFRTDDLDHLVECMERIISDRARLKEMGARSYGLVLSEHSPAKYVEKMVAIAEGHG